MAIAARYSLLYWLYFCVQSVKSVVNCPFYFLSGSFSFCPFGFAQGMLFTFYFGPPSEPLAIDYFSAFSVLQAPNNWKFFPDNL